MFAGVNEHDTPRHPELSVARLYKLIKEDVALLRYLPDPPEAKANVFFNESNYKCSKKFLWLVIATLRPDFASTLLNDA